MCPAFAHTYISYFYVDRSLKTDYDIIANIVCGDAKMKLNFQKI